jgi:hypothetical protein
MAGDTAARSSEPEKAVEPCTSPRYRFRVAQAETGEVKTFTKYSITSASTYPRAIAPIKLFTRTRLRRSTMASPCEPCTAFNQAAARPHFIYPARQYPCRAETNDSIEKMSECGYLREPGAQTENAKTVGNIADRHRGNQKTKYRENRGPYGTNSRIYRPNEQNHNRNGCNV